MEDFQLTNEFKNFREENFKLKEKNNLKRVQLENEYQKEYEKLLKRLEERIKNLIGGKQVQMGNINDIQENIVEKQEDINKEARKKGNETKKNESKRHKKRRSKNKFI